MGVIKPIGGILTLIIPISRPFPRVPEWGMPEGSHGNGDHVGWQVVSFRSNGHWSYMGWIYANEAEAKAAAAKMRRHHRNLERKRKSRSKPDASPSLPSV